MHLSVSAALTLLLGTPPLLAQALSVRHVLPEGELRPASTITVSFSRPLAGTLERLRDPATILRLVPALPARMEWRDPATIRIIPNDPLQPGSRLTIAIDTLTAPDGATLDAPWTREFRVRGVSVIGSSPPLRSDARATLLPTGRIELRTNGAVDATTLAQSARLEPSNAASCAAPSAPVRLRVTVRLPGENDYHLGGGRFMAVRDSLEHRFDRVVELDPATPLPEQCRFDLVLRFPDVDGGEEIRYAVETAAPLTVTIDCVYAPDCAASPYLDVNFSAAVSFSELRRALRVSSAQVTLPDSNAPLAYWRFPLKAKVGDTVRVAFDDLKDEYGRRLAPAPRVIPVGDRLPAWSATGGLITLPRRSAPFVRIRHVNIDSVVVTIYRLDVRPVDAYRATSGVFADSLRLRRAPRYHYVQQLEEVRNEFRETTLRLKVPDPSWLDAPLAVRIVAPVIPPPTVRTRGNFRQFVRWSPTTISFLLQHSDLMVHARAGAAGGGVFVTNVRTGAPVGGADVTLYNALFDAVATARTDARGLAVLNVRPSKGAALPDPPAHNEGVGFLDPSWPLQDVILVEASIAGDRSFASVRPPGARYWDNDRYGDPERERAVVSTDRDVYRPGEMTYFHAVVRDGFLDEMTAPRGARVRWRITGEDLSGDRAVLLQRAATLTRFGTHADSLRLPKNAELGEYTVALDRKRGSQWFQVSSATVHVAEYRAPEFLVTSAFEGRGAMRGDTLRAQVNARLLFDAPLVDGDVSWRATFSEPSPWDISIPGLGEGWIVGRSPTWWGADRPPPPTYASGTARTNAGGALLLAIPTDSVPFPRGAKVDFEASVRDVNGQLVSAKASTTIAPAAFYLASRVTGTSWWWQAGKPSVVRVGAITPQGRWVGSVTTQVVVLRHRWERGTTGGREFRMTTDTLQRDSLATRDSSATFSYVADKEGLLEIVFTSRDPRGREVSTSINRWVVGDGRGSWWEEDPQALPLFVSRDSLKDGDSVSVSFSSPYPAAHAWITVEREGILHQQRMNVSAGENTIALRVPSRWIPRVKVSVLLVRAGDLTNTESPAERYRLGSKVLAVDDEPRRIQLTMTPRAAEYRPGAIATIDVRLNDQRGRPVAGEAVLWATDEGVLSLTGFALRDLARGMLASPAGSLGFGSTLWSLVQELAELEPDARELLEGPGLAMSLNSVVATSAAMRMARAMPQARSDFRSTAFYRGSIATGADGRATIHVKVPDNLTTFRLMGLAVDSGRRFGHGNGKLLVTKPLLVRAAMPRFVRPADTFTAGAVVNTRGRPDDVRVKAMAAGDHVLRLSGAVQRDLTVGPRGALAAFDWTAGTGKQATYTVGVVSGALNDAVKLTIPVQPDQHRLAHTLVSLVRDSATLRFALPRDIDPGRSRLTIRVGPTPIPVIRTYTSHLEANRFACTEQLASYGMALVAQLQLERAGAARLADAALLRTRLQQTVDLVVERQQVLGSFGYWSQQSFSLPWMDAYIGAFLLDARDAGVTVAPRVLQMLGYALQNVLTSTPALPDTTYGTRADRRRIVANHLSQRLAAVEYLARTNAEVDHLEGIASEWWRLTFEDQARLSYILAIRPERRASGRRLLDQLWSQVKIAGNRADFPDSTMVTVGFPSRIRVAARLLRATQELDPRHAGIGPLIQRIIQRQRAEDGWWWNTQDYAFAATAIAAFVRGDASARNAYTLSGAAGQRLLDGVGGPDARELEMDLSELTTATGDSVTLPVHVRANGPVYVTLTVQEIRRERPVAPNTRGLIVERWYERATDGTPVTEVNEGDLVRVRLRVTAPGDREFVAVDDPLPAGLEAVDTRFKTSSVNAFLSTDALRSRVEQDGLAMGNPSLDWTWSWRSWNPWNDVTMHDDRVVFMARALGAGSHTYSYLARATTPGRFVRPQALAEEMYNPALTGRSDGGWFVVKARP